MRAITRREKKLTDVVVIEDEVEARKSILLSLEEFTNPSLIRIFTCEDEARRFFDRQNILSRIRTQPPIRLILLDLNIGGVKSFQTLRRLRNLKYTRYTPIVIFSDSSDLADIRRSYEMGANAFVTKPVSFTEFDVAVQMIAHFWLDMNRAYDNVCLASIGS